MGKYAHGEGALVGVLATLLVWSAVEAMLVVPWTRLHFEREAVQHGAATWTVDEDGNRVFQWRTAK